MLKSVLVSTELRPDRRYLIYGIVVKGDRLLRAFFGADIYICDAERYGIDPRDLNLHVLMLVRTYLKVHRARLKKSGYRLKDLAFGI